MSFVISGEAQASRLGIVSKGKSRATIVVRSQIDEEDSVSPLVLNVSIGHITSVTWARFTCINMHVQARSTV